MNAIDLLRELRQRKYWALAAVLVAALGATLVSYRISLFPPALEARGADHAVASTEILVDTPRPALGDLRRALPPLIERTGVYSRFIGSPVMRRAIAREMGIPASRLEIHTPSVVASGDGSGGSPSQPQTQGPKKPFRVDVVIPGELPVLQIVAQAPKLEQAEQLANGTVAVLREAVLQLQQSSKTPLSRQVKIRRLGSASGALVSGGSRLSSSIAVFVGLLALLLGTIYLAARIQMRRWATGPEFPLSPDTYGLSQVEQPVPSLHPDSHHYQSGLFQNGSAARSAESMIPDAHAAEMIGESEKADYD